MSSQGLFGLYSSKVPHSTVCSQIKKHEEEKINEK